MPGEKILDYWEPGRIMLSDPGAFLNSLVNYDKENMSETLINKLKPYINNPDFQPAKIITVSFIFCSIILFISIILFYNLKFLKEIMEHMENMEEKMEQLYNFYDYEKETSSLLFV